MGRSILLDKLLILVAPKHLDQSNKHNNLAPNPPYHLLCSLDIMGGDLFFSIAQSILPNFFQLQTQSTGGSCHRMPAIRTGRLMSITTPDTPGVASIATKEWSTHKNQ